MRKLKSLSRQEIAKIAQNYAYTPSTKSGEFFSNEYDISVSTFYNVLKKAILESIISEYDAKLISEKAADNTERHGGPGARKRTLDYYNSLIKQRAVYRLNRDEARKWTKKYIESDLDLPIFAKFYNLQVSLLKRALYDSFMYSWINDKEVTLLIEKTKKQKSEDLDEVFQKMIKERNLRK